MVGKRARPRGEARAATFLPLKPVRFHVLLALAAGESHGYAIRQEVELRTEGKVRLWPATLYGTLSELEEEGLIEETAGPRPADDLQRRYYRLSALGGAVLAGETDRLAALVRESRERQGRSRPREV